MVRTQDSWYIRCKMLTPNRLAPETLGPLIVGPFLFFLLHLYVYFMRNRLQFPMFPIALYGSLREYAIYMPQFILVAMLAQGASNIWPQQVRSFYTEDPIELGWYISAGPIVGSFLAPVWGLVLMRFPKYSRTILVSQSAALAFFVAIHGASINSPGVSTFFTCMASFFRVGLAVTMMSIVSLVPRNYIATSVCMALYFNAAGQGGGILISSLIFNNTIDRKLKTYVIGPLLELGLDPEIIVQITRAIKTGQTLTSSGISDMLTPAQLSVLMSGVKQSVFSTLKVIYFASIPFGVVAMLQAAATTSIARHQSNEIYSYLKPFFGRKSRS